MTVPWPKFARALIIAMGILVVALSSTSIVMCVAVIRAQDAQDTQSTKRVVAIDAVQAYSQQQACISRTNAAWSLAITDAILGSAQSDAQLAEAIERLRPIREDLATIEKRCIDAHPVPEQPAEVGP